MYSLVSRLCDNQSLQSHILGTKMTRKNIESSSCSKEGCLQSIERLKAQPVSRQWDLTSGGYLEAAKSLHNAKVLHNAFMNTTVMYYTCL